MRLEARGPRLNISPRRELRYALLAAMETCWAYGALAFLAAQLGYPRAVSPLTLFAAYWLALVVGRALPRSRQRWIVLQATAIGVAVVTLLLAARIDLYARFDVLDFAWLPRFVLDLVALPSGFKPEHLAALGVLYVFTRGLGFGQRPLTLWFVGFQFRLGVLIFFLLFLAAGLLKPFDASGWVFAYFFLSLLAIALARMDEMDGATRLGPRWAFTLLTAVAVVLFLGLGLLQFFTLERANLLLVLTAPLWWLVGILVLAVTLPAAFLAEWLAGLLGPILMDLGKRLGEVMQHMIPNDILKAAQPAAHSVETGQVLGTLLKTLVTLAVILTTGYLLARALNRRMQQIEDETYLRESLGVDDETARAFGARMAKPVKPRPRARRIAAESIRRVYAALVGRAAEAGLPRDVAETPYEFLPRLSRRWPAHAVDLRAITEAYVAVHYGEHAAAAAEVNHARAAWRRVEKTIR